MGRLTMNLYQNNISDAKIFAHTLLFLWLKMAGVATVAVVTSFWLLSTLLGVNLNSTGNVAAAVSGLGATFSTADGVNFTATIYNDANSSYSAGQQITAEFGAYHCTNVGTADCSPDQGIADYKQTLQFNNVTITAPAKGSSSQMTFNIPNAGCGRVQVDLGLPAGGGIVGGTVYSFSSSCQSQPSCVAPGPPTGLSPNGSILPASQTRVTLRWNPVAGATKYAVRLYNPANATPANPNITRDGLTGTSLDVDLQPGFSYGWWVHAGSGDVASAACYSTPTGANFTIAGDTPPCVSPGAPTNLSPNGQTLPAGTANTTISWNAMSGVTAYSVVFKTQSGTTLYSNDNFVGTSVNVSDLQNGRSYTWSVRPKNACGWGDLATANVYVANPVTTPPVGNPSCSFTPSATTISQGQPATFSSFYNPGGSSSYPVDFYWTLGDGASGSSGTNPQVTHYYNSVGTFPVNLTVRDSSSRSTSCSGTVYVTSQSQPYQPSQPVGQPSCSISPSLINQVVPFTANFFGSANAPSGRSITDYRWDFTSDGSFDASGSSASYSYTNSGSYQVRLRVFDSAGQSNDCYAAVLAQNQAVAPAPGGQVSLSVNKQITLSGQNYDNIPSSQRRFLAGELISYVTNYSVSGNQAAQNVVLIDDLPSWLDVSGTPSQGSFSGKRLTVNLGNLAIGTAGSVTYAAQVRSDLPVGETIQRNNTNLTAANATTVFDSASVVIYKQPAAGDAVISVTKTPLSQTVGTGGETAFTIRVRNDSGRDISGIQVFDDLPGGFSYNTNSTTGSTTSNPSISGNTLSWSGFSLSNGSEWSVSFKANAASTAGTFTNQARATAEGRSFGPSQVFIFVTVPGTIITAAAAPPSGQVLGVTTLPKTGPEMILFGGIPTLFGLGWRLRHFGDEAAGVDAHGLVMRRIRKKYKLHIFE